MQVRKPGELAVHLDRAAVTKTTVAIVKTAVTKHDVINTGTLVLLDGHVREDGTDEGRRPSLHGWQTNAERHLQDGSDADHEHAGGEQTSEQLV